MAVNKIAQWSPAELERIRDAAPELLDALSKLAYITAKTYAAQNPLNVVLRGRIEAARAAIRNATGEA